MVLLHGCLHYLSFTSENNWKVGLIILCALISFFLIIIAFVVVNFISRNVYISLFFFLLFSNSNTLKKFLRAFWIFVTLYFFSNWGLVPPIIKVIIPTNVYRASVICQALIWEPPRCSLVSSSCQSCKWLLLGRERPSNLPKSQYLVSAGSEARPSCSKAYALNHPPLLHALASGNF